MSRHDQHAHRTRIGPKEFVLALSAVAGAIVANFLICQLFIYAAEAGGHRRLPIADGVNLADHPPRVHRIARTEP